MAPLDSREEKIAEVRRALDTLQRLSMQLEAQRPARRHGTGERPERLWIDPAEQTPNALITATRKQEAQKPRRRLLPFAFALGAAGAASATAFAIVVGAIDLRSFFNGSDPVAATSSASKGAAAAPEAGTAAAITNNAAGSTASLNAPAATAASPSPGVPAAGSPQSPVSQQVETAPNSAATNSQTQVAANDPAAATAPGTNTPSPGSQPLGEAMAPEAALTRAQQLFTDGQILEARRILSLAQPEQSPDVAWALARSYDPRFLSTIQNPDASPDVAAAERWYRAWHAAAQQQGLVSNNMSVDKIIGSMR